MDQKKRLNEKFSSLDLFRSEGLIRINSSIDLEFIENIKKSLWSEIKK